MGTYPIKVLFELCEVLSGGTPKTTNPAYWNGLVPWASVKDFNTGNRWFSSTEKMITEVGLANCSSVLLAPGDLVLSARGTVGVVAQCGMRTAFNQSNYGLRAKESLASNDYLYYAISNAKKALLGDTHGGMFDTITRQTLARLNIPVPELEVQSGITNVLGTLDEKIETNKQLSKTLEDIAQTIFKSWFIDFDPVKAKMAGEKPVGMDAATAALFPGSMEDSELGLIPTGCEVSIVGAFSPLVYGKALPARDRNVGLINVFGSNGIVGSHDSALLQTPTIVIGRKGTVGTVNLHLKPSWVIDTAFSCSTETPENLYLAYLILRGLKLDEMNSDAAVPGLNRDNVHRLGFPIGTTELRQVFARIASLLFEFSFQLKEESQTLIEIRDALLPRLISGELQIPEEMLAL